MKKVKRISSIVLSIFMLFSMSYAEFNTETIDLFRQMLQDTYYKEITDEELEEAAIKGMFNSLDPYTTYYNAEETSTFEENVSGTYVGIGIKMESFNGYINVNQVFNNSPAKNAGVLPQDHIIKVNGQDVTGWTTTKVAALIRGEKGTEVTVTFARKNDTYEATMKRADVQVESCYLDILNDEIGYIKIEEFNASTYSEFESMYKTLKIIGTDKLIIDLRDNYGGYLSQCVAVSKLIVPKGPIVSIKYKNPDEDITYRSILNKKDMDIVVLVNNNTASASEIVAGALQDTKSATIVGTQTYGKGVVQKMYNLKNGGSVKITVAEYLTPNGTSINGVGITPDVIVEDEVEQLNKAIEILNNL